jgi:hypothetical protein
MSPPTPTKQPQALQKAVQSMERRKDEEIEV